MSLEKNYTEIKNSIRDASLIAVSKTKPIEDIKTIYDLGQRDFGENKVQELTEKFENLPKDIKWHMIGHLQSNKVKYIAPFVHLIHGVDSLKLLAEINKRAVQNSRQINCLLQIHIAQETTKFGLNKDEASKIIEQQDEFPNVRLIGLMGMATFTSDHNIVGKEFEKLNSIYQELKTDMDYCKENFSVLSMGMSADYELAIEKGSNMVRVGSSIFGSRN